MILGVVGFYAAQQDRLLGHLQGAHIFMTPSLSYSGVGYVLIQVSIFLLFVEFGWLLSLWKGARLR